MYRALLAPFLLFLKALGQTWLFMWNALPFWLQEAMICVLFVLILLALVSYSYISWTFLLGL